MSDYSKSSFVGEPGSRKHPLETIVRLLTSDDHQKILVSGIYGVGKTWCIRNAFEKANNRSCISVFFRGSGSRKPSHPIDALMDALEIQEQTTSKADRSSLIWGKLAEIECSQRCGNHKVAVLVSLPNSKLPDIGKTPPVGIKVTSFVKWVYERQIESVGQVGSKTEEIDQRIGIRCLTKHEVDELMSFRLSPHPVRRNWRRLIYKEVGRHPGLLDCFFSRTPDPNQPLRTEVGLIFDRDPSFFTDFYNSLKDSLPQHVRQDLERLLASSQHCENILDGIHSTESTGLVYRSSSNGTTTVRPTRLLQRMYDEWGKSKKGEKSRKPEEGKKMRVLSIGVNQYSYSPLRTLSWAVNDAREFADVFSNDEASVVSILLDAAATKTEIMAALQNLATRSGDEDTVVIFFAGHGMHNESGNYLCPSNANPDDLESTLISRDELSTALQRIRVSNLAVFLDACHAGGAAEIRSARGTGFRFGMQDEIVQHLLGPSDSSSRGRSESPGSAGRNRAIIAACGVGAGEVSYESPELRHGYFTYYLIEGLKGQAAHNGGPISVLGLATYVSTEVPKATRHLGSQNPFHNMHGRHFEITTRSLRQQTKPENGGEGMPTISIYIPRRNVLLGKPLSISATVQPNDIGYQYRWGTDRGSIAPQGVWTDSEEAMYHAPTYGSQDVIRLEVRPTEGSTIWNVQKRINLVREL